MIQVPSLYFFFFNDTATTEIYTLSLHDALPISQRPGEDPAVGHQRPGAGVEADAAGRLRVAARSEEHTSELQSRQYLVCRLLLEKKKNHSHHLTLTRTTEPIRLASHTTSFSSPC